MLSYRHNGEKERIDNMDKLKTLRKNANLTLAETSHLLNIPVRTYENWENGYRTPPIYLYKYIVSMLQMKTETTESILSNINKLGLTDSMEIAKIYSSKYGYIDTDLILKIQKALKKEDN